MVLNDLCKQLPASILIEDYQLHTGRPLFLSLIRKYSERGHVVRYFKYDSPLSSEATDLEQLKISPMNSSFNDNLRERWVSAVSAGGNILVAVDSLSPLLLSHSVGEILTAIKETLQSSQVSFIALVHGDVHNRDTLLALDYGFSCHLSLKPFATKKVCNGTLKKASGKITDKDEYYQVSQKWDLIEIEEVKQETSSTNPSVTTKNIIPTSSFKLDLNPSEEKARSEVILPYIRKQQNAPSTGNIVYEAEAADWDVEDPDDDLEI